MPLLVTDLNTDTGESGIPHLPEQIEMLDYVSSCNIATGFHAGDPYVMSVLIREAHLRGIAIGAHPAYPDRAGFGRQSMTMSADELYASLSYQIAAISGMCDLEGTSLRHIKLHGALYHDAHEKSETAHTVISFLKSWHQPLMLFGQGGTILEKMAREHDIPWVPEGFADRRYTMSGKLVPRSDPRGVISDRSIAVTQAINMIRDQKVVTADGPEIPINVRTLCIHGDHPNSLILARTLHNALLNEAIEIKSPKA